MTFLRSIRAVGVSIGVDAAMIPCEHEHVNSSHVYQGVPMIYRLSQDYDKMLSMNTFFKDMFVIHFNGWSDAH